MYAMQEVVEVTCDGLATKACPYLIYLQMSNAGYNTARR